MKVTKTEIHLSNFMFIKGSINHDRKLRFTLTYINYIDEGEPIGISLAGCIAYLSAAHKLTWHPPVTVTRGIYTQNCVPFRRLHKIVINELAKTKYAKKLTKSLLAYFEQTPEEVDPVFFNEEKEVSTEL